MKNLVSTKYPIIYKGWIFSWIAAFFSLTLLTIFWERENWWTAIWLPLIVCGTLVPRITRVIRNLKTIRADHQYLYISDRKSEIKISFNEISVFELKTIGGIYKIVLRTPHPQLGKRIYFMASILYPFNGKTIDKKMRMLRDNIRHIQHNMQIEES